MKLTQRVTVMTGACLMVGIGTFAFSAEDISGHYILQKKQDVSAQHDLNPSSFELDKSRITLNQGQMSIGLNYTVKTQSGNKIVIEVATPTGNHEEEITIDGNVLHIRHLKSNNPSITGSPLEGDWKRQ